MDQRDSLKALPGVKVVIEDFERGADAGFDAQAFKTDVELKLRMAGISVLEDHRLPWLYVNVTVLHRKAGQRAAFSVSLQLLQEAIVRSQLHSNLESSSDSALKSATQLTPTWDSGVVGFGAVADVRAVAKDLVDKFANDWLAVNPLKVTA